jgi:hypothetical protein
MSNVSYATPQVEDQEMGRVREIFDRALNALVDASTLAKEVEQVKSDLEGLKAQVTHYRNTIANQDDQITRLRQDRDAARTAQYHAEDEARHQVTKLENLTRETESLSSANVRLNERITEVSKERDEAQFKLLELTEAHNELSKKLDTIKSLFGTVATPVTLPPEPSTVNASTTPVALSASSEPTLQDAYDALANPSNWTDKPTEPEPPTNPPEPTPAQWPEDIKR